MEELGLPCRDVVSGPTGLRQVFIRGADLGVAALRFDLLVLAGFSLFFATIAALTIRREVV